MKRKYMTEFGLHTYSSQVTICYPYDLKHIPTDNKNHIYMINYAPRLSFVKDSLKFVNNSIRCLIKSEYDESENQEEFFVPLPSEFDSSDIKVEFDEYLRTLILEFPNDDIFHIRVLSIYTEQSRNQLKNEIMYIGQSYGTNGKRNASDRLSSHPRLQEILTDMQFKGLKRDITLTLWEFTPRLITSHDGISKQYLTSDEEDLEHMIQVLKDPPLWLSKELITITEAALINYFKPDYNKNFVNNFPDVEHGYQKYYNQDFNSITVELDPGAINISVFSKTNKYSFMRSIRYGLYPENVRKSMFEIFKNQ